MRNTEKNAFSVFPPQAIDATISLPASKSISNRALIIAALSGGHSELENISECDDTQVILDALSNTPSTVDIHASGTAMRFLTAYFAIAGGTHVLTGTDRMKQRPIAPLVDALRHLGADIEYVENEGYPPLRITGQKLRGGYVEIVGNVSSQYISALLLIAPMLPDGLELRIMDSIISRPYIDLTLDVMRDFGAVANWTSATDIKVEPQPYKQQHFVVESDWSAASYWYEMLALAKDTDAEIRLRGLVDGSRQGDSAVRYLFSMFGVKTTFGKDDATGETMVAIKYHQRTLPRLDYDFTNQPDIAQTFVVVCCLANIRFSFSGLSTLRIKETDRLQALQQEMRRLGYVIDMPDGNSLTWNGERCEPEEHPTIRTYNDHRMAMPFAAAAYAVPGITIEDPEVVGKSYPQFWNDMKTAGYNIDETTTGHSQP